MAAEKIFDNYLTKLFSQLVGELDRWAEGFDVLGFSKRYRNVMSQRHGVIKILGMAKAVPIDSIYVSVRFHKDIPSRFYVDAEAVAARLRARWPLDESEALSTVHTTLLMRTARRLLVLGRPGAGKTTLLKHVAVSLLSDQPPFQAFPVFVSLREFADSDNTTLLAHIAEDADTHGGFQRRTALPFFRRLLLSGECCLLLDGLDEVEMVKRQRVVSAIERTIAEYPEARIIVSCRTLDYRGWFTSIEEVEVADFGRPQVTSFITKWFAKGPGRAQALLQIYDDHETVRELCSTPLLSALICILYEYNIQLPRNRAELYSECIDVLLYKWDASRLIERRSQFSELSTARKKVMLAELAYELMEKQAVAIPRTTLVRALQRILKRYGIQGAEAVLDEIASHHAVLLERSAGVWSFMHLTFQEYFAALAIVQTRTEQQLITKHLHDPRWREVFLMVASLLPDPATFLRQLRQAILESHIASSLPPLFGFVWSAMTRKSGLKEAKDFVDVGWASLPEELRGKNKVNQVRGIRAAGDFFSARDLVSPALKEELINSFGKAVGAWNADEIRILESFGPGASDTYWQTVDEFARFARLYMDSCRHSMLGASLISDQVDTFLRELQGKIRLGARAVGDVNKKQRKKGPAK